MKDSLETFCARLSDLEREISEISPHIEGAGEESMAMSVYREVTDHLEEAKSFKSGVESGETDFGQLMFRQAAYDPIIRAQVQIDKLKHPEVDPLSGWVKLRSLDVRGLGREDYLIDTQLMRLYLDNMYGGAIYSWDYKPRKLNFCNVVEKGEQGLLPKMCMHEGLFKDGKFIFSNEGSELENKVLREGAETVSLQFTRKFEELGSALLRKNVSVKSGIGAHLKEATTGFNLEYWFEDLPAASSDTVLAVEWNLVLQSDQLNAINLYPLTAVAGVDDIALEIEKRGMRKNSEVQGGLYGLRYIDGLANLVMDFRFSKTIAFVETESLQYNEGLQGVRIRFGVPLSLVRDDMKTTTLFVSIA